MTAPLLIFGAEGQVGSALQRQCERENRPYVAFDRDKGDITSLACLSRIAERHPEGAIINAAAYTAVDRAEEDQETAFAVNTVGPAFLASQFKRRPLIHFSTDYVFNGEGSTPYLPSSETSPLGVYGMSKRMGERAVLSSSLGTVLRTAWVYGPDGGNFLKTMIRVGRDRGALKVVDDQHGTPTHADTIASATLAVLDAQARGEEEAAPGLYHLTSKGSTSWFGFAQAIFGELEKQAGEVVEVAPIPTTAYPTPAKRPAYSVLDCEKLDKISGISRPDWREPISKTVAMVLANNQGASS